ncbi:hypothetical protein LMG28688_00328 [Paraburkholderia caffeinitolerans]|uniref:Uncharacterized protein n=1 Tax=Paraburkholderia caffeinitolerans TaxID=1723730 RepID=A0A6J5FCY7_9BURK|nr:hypothetical protein LMG28688_00328 [Paraburkholderia caffeinitolerans]
MQNEPRQKGKAFGATIITPIQQVLHPLAGKPWAKASDAAGDWL